MEVKVVTKRSFTVFGKEGRGEANRSDKWIPPLWKEAREKLSEILNLAKLDTSGHLAGFWGAMSDTNREFAPWGEQGLYLAGCEVTEGLPVPNGWTKWVIPSYRYAVTKCTKESYAEAFGYMRKVYMPKNNYKLAGAVHEFYSPKDKDGTLYLFFPIEKL